MKKIVNIISLKYLRGLGAVLIALMSVLVGGCSDDNTPDPASLTTTPPAGVTADTLRLLSYNILEGMKNDKANNFDNFVAWVQDVDPDVFAIQETNNFNQASLEALAARYGHNYALYNAKGGYPVSITSKHPIEVVSQMVGSDVYHGGLHVRIKGVNFVVFHLYPFTVGEINGFPNGDAYRVSEVNVYMSNTIGKYPTDLNWFMMGDFNSFSPLDKNDYDNGVVLNYDVHTAVLNSGYQDVIRFRYNYFVASTTNGNRIDYIYASESMIRNVVNAKTILDDFTKVKSDHYPLVVDYRVETSK